MKALICVALCVLFSPFTLGLTGTATVVDSYCITELI